MNLKKILNSDLHNIAKSIWLHCNKDIDVICDTYKIPKETALQFIKDIEALENKQNVNNQYHDTPSMLTAESEEIEQAIKRLLNERKRITILEYGAGGSTTYFVKMLEQLNADFEYYAIEHNIEWAKKIKKRVNSKALHIITYDYGIYSRHWVRASKINMDEYVNEPLKINKNFDIVIVDGRKRERCMAIAKDVCNGMVYLHDNNREEYQDAIKLFENYESKTVGNMFCVNMEKCKARF